MRSRIPITAIMLFAAIALLLTHLDQANSQCVPRIFGTQPIAGIGFHSETIVNDVVEWHRSTGETWWVFGGEFGYAGNAMASSVVAYDGQSWHALGDELGFGEVHALAIYRDQVFAAGHFQVDGMPAFLARWNGMQWISMGADFSGSVRALEVFQDQLVVGGLFNNVDGNVARGVAVWDGDTGTWVQQPFGTNPPSFFPTYALQVVGNRLYIGGEFFITIPGQSQNRGIAYWDGNEIGSPGLFTGDIRALAAAGENLLAAGELVRLGGTATYSVAEFDRTNWAGIGTRIAPIDDRYVSVAQYQGMVHLAGAFQFNTPEPPFALNIARWNGTAWEKVGDPPEQGVYGGGPSGPPFFHAIPKIKVIDDELVALGKFNAMGFAAAAKIGIWDGTTWRAVAPGIAPFTSIASGFSVQYRVNAMTPYKEGAIVACGMQITNQGNSARGVGYWDGFALLPFPSQFNGEVCSITVINEDIYVAGSFTSENQTTMSNIARWNGDSWQSTSETFISSPFADYRYPLMNWNGNLYAAGTNRRIYRYDDQANTWTLVGTANVNPLVFAEYEGDMLVGGSFTSINGQAARYIARYDGMFWSAIDPIGPGEPISALFVDNQKIYAAGESLHVWDGEMWTAHELPDFDGVRCISKHRGEIYLGGFNFRNGSSFDTQARLARFDGIVFEVMLAQDIAANSIESLLEYEDKLLFGGHGILQNRAIDVPIAFGVFGCPPGLGDLNCDGAVTVSDIGPFVIAVIDNDDYAVQYPECELLNADTNGDGAVTVSDIGDFVSLLTGA